MTVGVAEQQRVSLFVPITDKTCAIAVTFPSVNVRRDLPLNHPVDIQVTPQRPVRFAAWCELLNE